MFTEVKARGLRLVLEWVTIKEDWHCETGSVFRFGLESVADHLYIGCHADTDVT